VRSARDDIMAPKAFGATTNIARRSARSTKKIATAVTRTVVAINIACDFG
jgi:hypothetical protein